MDNLNLLKLCLDVAVTFRRLEYEQRGGPTDEDIERARRTGEYIAGPAGGSLIYRPGPKEPRTAEVFNRLADSLAVAACGPPGQPGGALERWFGRIPSE